MKYCYTQFTWQFRSTLYSVIVMTEALIFEPRVLFSIHKEDIEDSNLHS